MHELWFVQSYLFGTDRVVKYGIVPTSHTKSTLPRILSDDYLTENMEKHLSVSDAGFDFMIQVQKDPDRMPVEDAGVEWSEKESLWDTSAFLPRFSVSGNVRNWLRIYPSLRGTP